ncbi:MAG: NGG1p interacting factor NIF3 [Nitrospirota bacterium]
MRLRDLYKKAVETAIANDPRGLELVQKELDSRRKEYEKLKDEDKEYFDLESLENPYSDSRILFGTGDEEVRSALVGIDMEGPVVVLAYALREKGEPIDLMIAHHPEGRPFASLYDVMGMQADILGRVGVPISVAEDLMEKRIREVERRLLPANHTRAVDAARLLGIPFMCMHTLADNMVATYLQRRFDEEKPYRVSDIVDMLNSIPEYQEARRQGVGPKVLIGSDKRTSGRVFVDMTGGTGGSKDIFRSLATSGVSTIVGMHIGEEHRKEAEKNHVNVVIAGHISSDNLGVNLLLDELSRQEPLKVYECSGFRRVSRL